MEIDYAVTDTVGRALIKRYTDETTHHYEVYDISFDPTSLSPVDTPFPSTDPYVSFRFISTGGAVYASGVAGGTFGANDNQVAPGIWVTLGAGPSMTLGPEVDVHWASSYLQGSSSSTNGADRRIYVPQPLQTEPNQGIIRATMLKLRDALVAEGNSLPPGSCAAWLNTGSISGAAMIDILLEPFPTENKDRFGHGVISRLPDKIVFSSWENHIAAFTWGENPGGVPVGIPVYFAVTFNDNGAFFSAFDRSSGKELRDGPYRGGTAQAQVRILVHELAHIDLVPGFRPDFLDDEAGRKNDLLVEENCSRLVG